MRKLNPEDICACILFFEKASQTIDCIKSLLPSNISIAVCNNGSSKEQTQILKAFCQKYKQITFFDQDANLGVSGGRNYLIKNTSAPWLFFLDNDIVVKTNTWLERFSEAIQQFPEMEVFIPKLFLLPQKEYAEYRSLKIEDDRIVGERPHEDMVNSFPGGAAFVHRGLFNRLGFYDEGMFTGFEDLELCIRAIKKGESIKARLLSNITLHHIHKVAQSESDKKAIGVRYDNALLRDSYQRIVSKHGLRLDGDPTQWANIKIEEMIHDNVNLKVRLKRVIPYSVKWLKRQLNKISL